jgi:hypothetical protein
LLDQRRCVLTLSVEDAIAPEGIGDDLNVAPVLEGDVARLDDDRARGAAAAGMRRRPS